jgi:hypothetical protein
VPHSPSQLWSRLFLGYDELIAHIQRNPIVIAMVPGPIEPSLLTAYIQCGPLFRNATFVLTPPHVLKKYLNRKPPPQPYLVVIMNNATITAVGPILDQLSMVSLIDLYLTQSPRVLDTEVDLYGFFMSAATTLIAPYPLIARAVGFLKIAPRGSGVINVGVISHNLEEEMNWSSEFCGVYRRADSAFENFECTAAKFVKNLKPTSVKFGPRMVKNSEHLVAVFYRDASESDVRDALFELGSHFSDFSFVIVPPMSLQLVRDLVGPSFGDSEGDLAVMNFTGGYFFNLSRAVSAALRSHQPYDIRRWANIIAQTLYHIRAGNLPKLYRSEPVISGATPMFQKLVGHNYADVVGNEGRDIFVLFLKPQCRECQNWYNLFFQFAEEIEEVGSSTYHFGFIDIAQNAIEVGFPAQKAPLIVLYPAFQTGACALTARPELLPWFAQRFAAARHSLPVEPHCGKFTEIQREMLNGSRRLWPELRGLAPLTVAALKEDCKKWGTSDL